MTIESAVIAPNPDRTETIIERSCIHADAPLKDSNTTHMDTFAFDAQGNISGRVEIFKLHVQKIT